MLYLHIGAPKTGSTTIQSLIKDHIEDGPQLSKLRSPGLGNAWKFSVAANTNISRRYWIDYRKLLTTVDYDEICENFWADLRQEVKYSCSRNFVASTEYIYNHSGSSENIREFCLRLMEIFGDVRIIAYVRDQTEWAKSFYAQMVKGPGKTFISYEDYVERFRDFEDHWNYYRSLSPWADILGEARLIFSLFSEYNFVNKSLSDDFLFKLGIDPQSVEASMMKKNVSPNFNHLEILRRTNKMKNIPRLRWLHSKLFAVVMKNRGFIPDRDFPHDADSVILDHVSEGNEKFNARFLNEQKGFLPTVASDAIPTT